jgi:hypothetical protein
MSSRKPLDEVWFVHAPLKREKEKLPVVAPPPSNIPYLNGVMDTEEELNANRQHVIFRDTDSKFIRLAKLGGREDLLVHRDFVVPKEPVGYPRTEWWTDMLNENDEKSKQEKKSVSYFITKMKLKFSFKFLKVKSVYMFQ